MADPYTESIRRLMYNGGTEAGRVILPGGQRPDPAATASMDRFLAERGLGPVRPPQTDPEERRRLRRSGDEYLIEHGPGLAAPKGVPADTPSPKGPAAGLPEVAPQDATRVLDQMERQMPAGVEAGTGRAVPAFTVRGADAPVTTQSLLADMDREHRERLLNRGEQETGVRGAMPLSTIMANVFGSGMGQPGYGSPKQRLMARGIQSDEAARALAAMDSDRRFDLEARRLGDAKSEGEADRASRERIAGMAYGPQAQQAAGDALAMQALFENAKTPAEVAAARRALDQMTAGRGPTAAPAAVGGVAGAMTGPAAPAAGPSQPQLDSVERLLGPTPEPDDGDKRVVDTPEGRKAAMELIGRAQTPEQQQSLVRRLDEGGAGTLSALQEEMARQLAVNAIRSGQVRQVDGRSVVTPVGPVPDRSPLIELFEQQPEGYLGQLGRRMARGAALGTPFNRIRLPDGREIPFDARDAASIFESGLFDPEQRRANAMRQLPTDAAAMRALLGGR